MNFEELHQQENPLLICNVWDVTSAQMAERLQFQALATSSSAMAAILGYRDGEEMEFAELAYLVKRIAANIQTPLSVDLEGGYARDAASIALHIQQLHDLGVVGVNLEDSVVGESRTQLPAESFARTVEEVKETLVRKGMDVFLNVRTDAFILGKEDAVEDSGKRIKLYEAAGADGIFIPYISQEDDMSRMLSLTNLPINVLNKPNLPSLDRLGKLGIKRVSMGNGFFDAIYRQGEQLMERALSEGNLAMLF